MWGNKKPDTPQSAHPAPSNPIVNQTPQPQPKAAPAPASWEEKPVMSTDAMRPMGSSGGFIARLGSTLLVKGGITGSEDLQIDGAGEGLIQLHERKMDAVAAAQGAADTIAPRVEVDGA